MGGAVSAGVDNDDLIDNLVEGSYVKTENIQRLFRCVDRGMYYLPEHKSSAYRDVAWKEGNLHLSAPCIYAEVMESLDVRPGMSFLNIGSGTGYLSTMVGLLLGTDGVNHGIEVHESNVKYAGDRLQEFLKTSVALRYFDFAAPKFVVGNGLKLSLDSAGQYDRIYVGSSCDSEERCRFLGKFLKIGGLMVVPCGDFLIKMRRDSADTFTQENLMQCSFAALVIPPENLDYVRPPERSWIPLKIRCRAVVMASIRKRILHDNKSLAMPRTTAKHPERPRRHQRVVFPLLIAQNDDDDEPQIVLGNPIHSNDNGNDAPNDLMSEDDEPSAHAQRSDISDFFDDDGSSAGVPRMPIWDEEGQEAKDGPSGPSEPSGLFEPSGPSGDPEVGIARKRLDLVSDSESGDLMTDDDDEALEGPSGEMHSSSSSGPFSPGTKRLFRKRRLSSARLSSSEPPSSSTSDDGSKRRSVVQFSLQPPRLSATLSMTSGSVTLSDLEVSSPSSSTGSSLSSGQNQPQMQSRSTGSRTVRIRAMTSSASTGSSPDSKGLEESASEPSFSSTPVEIDPVQSAAQMEGFSREAVKSLEYPTCFKRFLNFDRPLE